MGGDRSSLDQEMLAAHGAGPPAAASWSDKDGPLSILQCVYGPWGGPSREAGAGRE